MKKFKILQKKTQKFFLFSRFSYNSINFMFKTFIYIYIQKLIDSYESTYSYSDNTSNFYKYLLELVFLILEGFEALVIHILFSYR